MHRVRDAEQGAVAQSEAAAVTIAAGQTESLSGIIRGDVSFDSGGEVAVVTGTTLAVYGHLIAAAPASVAIGEGASFYAAGAVDPGLTLDLGSGSTLDLAAQDLSAMAGTIAGFVTGSIVDIISGTITGALSSDGIITLSQDGGTIGSLRMSSSGASVVLAVPDPVDGTRLLQAPPMPAITAAAPGTGFGETVRWIGGPAGQWNSTASWQTVSGDPGEAPGTADVAILEGPSNTALMVAGDGAAATLSTSGIVALAGGFAVGLLRVGQSPADVLDLQPGASMQATDAVLTDGFLQISGAQSSLSVAGTFTLAAGGIGWVADGGALLTDAVLMQGGTLRLDPAGTLAIGSAPGLAGTLCVGPAGMLAGFGAIRAPLVNNGLIQSAGGLLALYGSIGGSGTLAIDGTSSLYAPYGAAAGQTVVFDAGASGTLELFATAFTCAAAIVGVAPADAIDIAGATLSQASWTATAGTLGVLDLGDAGSLSVDLASAYAGTAPDVVLSDDGSGGTLIQIVPCFGAESHLATPSGRSAAGTLRPGMRVLTRSGAARRVRWVGRRNCSALALRKHPELRPVRILAGSLRGVRNSQCQDLVVSPQHGMLVPTAFGARLIPAITLVDGQTVRRELPPEGVGYVHLELDSHDCVLAEGLETETYLRGAVDQQPAFHRAAGHAAGCVQETTPRLECGYHSDASHRVSHKLVGHVDQVVVGGSSVRLSGWVYRGQQDHMPQSIAVLADGVLLGATLADRWRPDLEHDPLRDSRSGFTATVPWNSSLRHRRLTIATLPPLTSGALATGPWRGSSGQPDALLDRKADPETPQDCPAVPPRPAARAHRLQSDQPPGSSR